MIDRFYVVRTTNEHLEKVRKALRKELTANQRRGPLKDDRKILLKRAHDASGREQLIMEIWTGGSLNFWKPKS
ncbi:hypothetical protein CEK60_04625 [Halomonas sp. N3-2A]|nr:hypothetical protein CEK60_04625 [Halomonas sp. N3-2A]